MGSGGGPSGGGDKNRGVERGRTRQPAVAVTKPTPPPVVTGGGRGDGAAPKPDFGVVKRQVSTVAPEPAPKPAPDTAGPKAFTRKSTMPTAKVGFGTEVIDTAAAQAQLSARKKTITESPLSKIPTIGGVAAKIMGESNIERQKKALREGGAAVAVPGTSFAPQGQRYTEAPGMRSSAELAGQRFAVGTQGGEARQGPSGKIGQISATKPPAGSGLGYIGDVAGVVRTKEIAGIPVTTFSGQSGYSPTGVKIDETILAKSEPETVRADVTPEITPEITPEVTALADETVLGRGRRRTKRAGPAGTMEEIGVLVRGGSPRATV